MWVVDNNTPFPVDRGFLRDRQGGEVWIVVIKGSFEVQRNGGVRAAAEQTPPSRVASWSGEPGKSSLLHDTDFVLKQNGTDVLVRVHYTGICGTDVHIYKWDEWAQKTISVPMTIGHEFVGEIVAVGSNVNHYKVGERCLVQTDYRDLPTAGSASAFGYNFEGALQEYVLVDERVITAPDGESMLIPAPEDLSASAIALVEPWACVENAYTEVQRRTLKPGGRLLVVGDAAVDRGRRSSFRAFFVHRDKRFVNHIADKQIVIAGHAGEICMVTKSVSHAERFELIA